MSKLPYRMRYSLGYLCACCQQQLFERVMVHLLVALEKERNSPSSMSNTRTYIQAMGAIRLVNISNDLFPLPMSSTISFHMPLQFLSYFISPLSLFSLPLLLSSSLSSLPTCPRSLPMPSPPLPWPSPSSDLPPISLLPPLSSSRQAGQRVGGHLDAVVPLIMHFVGLRDDQGDDELKECCLQAFEALALRCFREITPYIKEVRWW